MGTRRAAAIVAACVGFVRHRDNNKANCLLFTQPPATTSVVIRTIVRVILPDTALERAPTNNFFTNSLRS